MMALNKNAQRSGRQPDVRIAKNVYRSSVVGTLLKVFWFALAAFFIVYTCFAATLVRIVPSMSLGPVPVKNMTYPGGTAPAGAALLVSTEKPQGTGMQDRLAQAFIPTERTALVTVVTGPTGKLAVDAKGGVSVGGKAMGVTLKDASKKEYLMNEYIVTCRAGDCTTGSSFIVPADRIYGTALSAHAEQSSAQVARTGGGN